MNIKIQILRQSACSNVQGRMGSRRPRVHRISNLFEPAPPTTQADMSKRIQRVLLVHLGSEDFAERKGEALEFETFSVPSAEGVDHVVYAVVRGELLEWNVWKPKFGTWMVGDALLKDSSMYMASPSDPLYAMLPLLERSRKRSKENDGVFCDLEHVLSLTPESGMLMKVDGLEERMRSICEVKEVGSSMFYRLCDEKTLAWLQCKVDQVIDALRIHGGNTYTKLGEEEMVSYAVEFLSEYVDEAWTTRLRESLNIQKKADDAWTSFGDIRDPTDVDIPSPENAEEQKKRQAASKSKHQEEAKKRARQAKDAAAAKGTRRLTSFFAKKG